MCLEFTFDGDRIHVKNVDPTGIEGLAHTLPLHARMAHLLKGGPMTIAAIAKELDAKVDSIEKAVKRGDGRTFTCVTGKDGINRWALIERRVA